MGQRDPPSLRVGMWKSVAAGEDGWGCPRDLRTLCRAVDKTWKQWRCPSVDERMNYHIETYPEPQSVSYGDAEGEEPRVQATRSGRCEKAPYSVTPAV